MKTGGLLVEDLSWSYGARPALDDVSFTVAPGRFCALLGPNGAGKTTLFSLLTRLFDSRSGRIEIAGVDLRRRPGAALARMGVVFQQPTLDLDLSVLQNMRYFAALHGLQRRGLATRIEECLGRLGMAERAGEKVRSLNGGHRRRMEIARALLHAPEVLLLDEPTVGLDSVTRSAITGHVHALCETEGLTVLWATHLVDEVRDDDDLVLLDRGRVIARGAAKAVTCQMGVDDLAGAFRTLTKEEASV